jgi:Domain of unknown function (DUF4349)
MQITSSLAERFRALVPSRRRTLLVTGALLVLVALVAITGRRPTSIPDRNHAQGSKNLPETPMTAPLPTGLMSVTGDTDLISRDSRYVPAPQTIGAIGQAPEPRAISYSAELAIASKDFAHARSAMEEVLDRHNGYTARLRMTGLPTGSTLSATLCVPVSEYPSALAELKSIGTVERDEEAADEIAQQHGDIAARLRNVQNAVQHFEQMLKDNDGKTSPFFVQQQLTQLRAEIARLEAERRAFDNRAALSNIYVTLREERGTPAESFAGQLHAATLSGLSDVLGTLAAIALFCVNYGPSLLLWAALLFYPFRLLWRRVQAEPARTAA